MRRRLLAAASAAFVAASYALAGAARADDDPIFGTGQERELRSGGIMRTYRVVPTHVASSYGRALIMVLHGGFGTAAHAQQAYGWDEVATFINAEIVYPEGVGRSWNAGRCCGPARERGVDDVAFLTAVIRDAVQRDGIDPRNIFVTGMSNGAIMAYRLACEGPIALAAIGPVAGALEVPCTAPVAPVSVMAIHGTADQNVPFAGGIGAKAFVKVEHASVASSLARWRAIDGCRDQPSTVRTGAIVRESTTCAGGTEVVLVAVEGAGHQWPGAVPAPPAVARLLELDPPSRALSATDALRLFFLGHVASSPGPNGGR